MSPALPASATNRIRVLVVDDSRALREGLVELLELKSDAVQVVGSAADGAEAVLLADELRPDVVLMDMRMPRMGGLEATGRIQAKHPEIAVLIFTTETEPGIANAARLAGAADVLIKGEAMAGDLLAAILSAAQQGHG